MEDGRFLESLVLQPVFIRKAKWTSEVRPSGLSGLRLLPSKRTFLLWMHTFILEFGFK